MNKSRDHDFSKREKTSKKNDLEFDLLQWVEDRDEDKLLNQDFLATKEQDELLENINDAIGKQVSLQMEEFLVEEELEKNKRKRNHMKKGRGIAIILITSFILIYILLISPVGKELVVKAITAYTYDKVTMVDTDIDNYQVVEDEVIINMAKYSYEELRDSYVSWDLSHTVDGPMQKEGVVNILLLGEESIESVGGRGRTDLMMIATLNKNTNEIKLTSLMRDTLVRIPGNKDNKLNAAYTIGGISLLYKTIEHNFDIKMDGYMLVGFQDFEKIIDKLGGVYIDLTEEEAAYLRKTNYIQDPNNRNVKAGHVLLNGGQALGYCRIRYVATSDNQRDDYGRTSRQRALLNGMFEKYKTKSATELLSLMNDIIPLIKTDISKKQFESYLNDAISIGLPELSSLRIPAENNFKEGFVRKMQVLIPNTRKNIEILHEFVFGK